MPIYLDRIGLAITRIIIHKRERARAEGKDLRILLPKVKYFGSKLVMEENQITTERPKLETLITAQEEYFVNGKIETARCERCKSLLVIEMYGNSAWKVSCSCGLYNDTLRGV